MPVYRRTPRPSAGSLIPSPTPSPEDVPGAETAEQFGFVEPLNAAELVWTAQHRELLAELCDGDVDAENVGALADRVQAAWLASDDRADPEPLVNAFAVALGDLVAARLPGLGWYVYRDSAGSELVLAHPRRDVVLFPVCAVGARWPAARRGWFAACVEESLHVAMHALHGSDDETPDADPYAGL
jgi:hypothetical protein